MVIEFLVGFVFTVVILVGGLAGIIGLAAGMVWVENKVKEKQWKKVITLGKVVQFVFWTAFGLLCFAVLCAVSLDAGRWLLNG